MFNEGRRELKLVMYRYETMDGELLLDSIFETEVFA